MERSIATRLVRETNYDCNYRTLENEMKVQKQLNNPAGADITDAEVGSQGNSYKGDPPNRRLKPFLRLSPPSVGGSSLMSALDRKQTFTKSA